jgi:hypothetical protein
MMRPARPTPGIVLEGRGDRADQQQIRIFILDLVAIVSHLQINGFPYSRMADLADTLVVVPKAPTQGQVETLLQALGLQINRRQAGLRTDAAQRLQQRLHLALGRRLRHHQPDQE